MRKTKFVAVLLAVVMVLAMSASAFASSPGTHSSQSPTGGSVTTEKATAVDANGNSVTVTTTTLTKKTETMKAINAAGSAEKFVVSENQKLAAAVALATQHADLDDLSVVSAMNVKVAATKENPVTVTFPIDAAQANGSVVVMVKTDDGWTVVPATIAAGKVSATLEVQGEVVVLTAPATATAPAADSEEVKAGAWYEKYENFAIIADIVDEDDVRPEEVTTRGDFILMLYNMMGKPAATTTNEFTDMEGFEAYEAAMNWAVENGVVAGYGDGTVRCANKITREEMVKMMYNFAVYQKTNTTDTTELTGYTDADQVSTWAETAVKWAKARGIVQGTSLTTMAPKNDSLRCQAVTVLYNYVTAK